MLLQACLISLVQPVFHPKAQTAKTTTNTKSTTYQSNYNSKAKKGILKGNLIYLGYKRGS